MEYSSLTMAEIIHGFIEAKQGKAAFYSNMQHIIMKGHYFKHELAPVDLAHRMDGQLLAYLSRVYSHQISKGL